IAGLNVGAATLADSGAVTQTAAITSGSLTLLGAGGSYTPTRRSSDLTTLSATTGTINVVDSTDLTIAGLNVGAATLADSGAVTQTAAITAGSLTLLGAGEGVTLSDSRNKNTTRSATAAHNNAVASPDT